MAEFVKRQVTEWSFTSRGQYTCPEGIDGNGRPHDYVLIGTT